jgi:peroxiredoxin Q/BCP
MEAQLTKAPAFDLFDQHMVRRRLEDYFGIWVVLYFYPLDNSLGCTTEACDFRDEYRIITQFGAAEVIGINKGSVASHKKFADRHHLNFPILSDPGHVVTKAYGAWRLNTVRHILDKAFATRRNTYLIDPNGMIAKEYISVDPNNHALEVIGDLQELQSQGKKMKKVS